MQLSHIFTTEQEAEFHKLFPNPKPSDFEDTAFGNKTNTVCVHLYAHYSNVASPEPHIYLKFGPREDNHTRVAVCIFLESSGVVSFPRAEPGHGSLTNLLRKCLQDLSLENLKKFPEVIDVTSASAQRSINAGYAELERAIARVTHTT